MDALGGFLGVYSKGFSHDGSDDGILSVSEIRGADDLYSTGLLLEDFSG